MSNEALSQLPHKLATLIRSLPQAPFREHLAAECIKQAERIAELEARVHTCGPTCSKAGCINRRLTTERDQLRAEVERLRADAERWHVANLTAETAWKHPDHRSQEENTAFSAYRCAVEDGLNFEGAVDAAVAAIDQARTTHKDEG